MNESETASAHPWHIGRLATAWAIAVLIGVFVAFVMQGETRFQGLVFATGLSVVVTFLLQISTAQRDGFIARTSFSVAGSVLIIAVIDAVITFVDL